MSVRRRRTQDRGILDRRLCGNCSTDVAREWRKIANVWICDQCWRHR